MIFADKLVRLRKQNGWSQEELADKMEVSRQAVSKWESAQSVPSLEKLLQLSALFGVTTDYLLKDELETEEFVGDGESASLRRLTLSEAGAYLKARRAAAPRIAAATFLCILCPIPLLILAALSEVYPCISEALAGGIGLVALLLLVTAAVVIFLKDGFENKPYEFLEEEAFETEYGVKGMVLEQQKAFRPAYVRYNIIGTCLCILSPIPLFAGAFSDNDLLCIYLLTVTMAVAGIGVIFFLLAQVPYAGMQKLLQEGEYSAAEKKKSRIRGAVSTIYWLTATAIFLGWSLGANSWRISWVIWPVAGVLFAGVMIFCNLFLDKKERS